MDHPTPQANEAKIEASPHSADSSLREQALGHLFLGQLLAFMWRNGARDIEVLKSEVDRGGYDVVLEANGIIRHVQLKSSFRGSKVREVDVSTKLLRKPGGCVLWLEFDRESLAIERFYLRRGGDRAAGSRPPGFPPFQGQQRRRKKRAPDPSRPDQGAVRGARRYQRSGREVVWLGQSFPNFPTELSEEFFHVLGLNREQRWPSDLLNVSAIDQFSRFFSKANDIAHRYLVLLQSGFVVL